MKKGPKKQELIKKILKELKKHPKGIWIRKLSRNINEPLASVYKYITRKDYCGEYIVIKKIQQELGGHKMIKLRRDKKWKKRK